MSIKLSPHIRFSDSKCREGMNFYKDIFGGKLTIMTVGDMPKDVMSGGMENLPKDNVMHASLEASDLMLLGADAMRDPVKVGDQVSIMIDCASRKEVDEKFSKLAKGGDIFMKPEKAFWGGYFASVTDKYGVEWSLNFQEDQMKM